MAEFRMPSLGSDMESGTLTEWMVAPGDEVARGDLVASVETSKGIIDIEIFESGVIDELIVQPGTEVPVGEVLATYTAKGEPAAGESAAPKTHEAESASQAESPSAATAAGAEPPESEPSGRGRVSPAARRRARELGVELGGVRGSGPGGAVTIEDVEAAHAGGAPSPRAAPQASQADARHGDMREVIAKAMSRSKREIPHYYLATTIDMTPALEWLEAWNAGHPVTERLLYSALLIKAVAHSLEVVPELNGFWRDDGFEPADAINVGFAIRLRRGGLVAPAIEAADEKPLTEIMRALQGLVQRARTGRLQRTELTSPTVTISSLGEDSVEEMYPIIYPPQVAIVGFGSIVERPWCRDGELVAAKVITASLSADHRASDGARGGRFLADVDRRLQQPEQL